MADFYVRNSLNINKAVRFNITLRYFVIKGGQGEHFWTLEIGTTHFGADGGPISGKKVHNISVDNLDDVIESTTAELCTLIDWSPLIEDREAPYVDSVVPSNGSIVSIGYNVEAVLKDHLPSAGIDLSSLRVILNNSMQDFDITSEFEVTGDPYQYELRWITPLRVYSRYD